MKSTLTTAIITLIILLLFVNLSFADDISKKSDSWHSDGAESIYPYWGLFAGSYCSMSGYDKCYQWEDGYKIGCALAQWNAKMAYSLPERKYCPNLGWYTLNDYKIKYKCVGDRAYALFATSEPYCDAYGCSPPEAPKEGAFTVSTTVGNVKDKSIWLLCHDYDFDSCGGYSVDSGGYVAWHIKLGNDYVLNCCSDTDCGTGMLCDKTGDYTKWHCKADPCYGIECSDKCTGQVKYTNGKCVDGNCQYTETKAKNHCVGQMAYYNGYCVGNEIEYNTKICEDSCSGTTFYQALCKDGNCMTTTIESKDYCIGDEKYYNGVCKDNKLSYETEHCPFGCTDGVCNDVVPITEEPDIDNYIESLINSIKSRLADLWGLVLEMFKLR